MYSLVRDGAYKRIGYSGKAWTGASAQGQINRMVSACEAYVDSGILAWDSRDYNPATDYTFNTLVSDYYHFNDVLHATYPLYLRISHIVASTSGSGSVYQMGFHISFDNSDWTAGLFGLAGNGYYTSVGADPYPVRIALTGDTGWLGFAVNDGYYATQQDINFLVSRAVDQETGQFTSGASVTGNASGGLWSTYTLSHEYLTASYSSQVTWVPQTGNFSTSVAPSTELDAHRIWYPLDGQMLCNPYIVVVYSSEFTFGQPFSAAPFSPHGSHTFMPMNRSFLSTPNNIIQAHKWEA